jgi:hypothetical protein
MEVDMALVRRGGMVGRAQGPGPMAAPAIPHQGATGPAVGSAPVVPLQPGQEMAAAVPSHPAKAWAVVAGLGLAAGGAMGAFNINALVQPSQFEISGEMSTFAALFVFAAAVERVLEPFSRWMPGRTEQERYEKAVADLENGVPGAMNAAAHYKAAVDQARLSRGILMWGIATCVATLLSASSGFYIMRLLSANPSWNGVDVWVDALITGLVVGSGTKPLHDIISRVQHQANVAQTPV